MSFLFTVDAFVNPLLNFGRSKDMRRAVRDLFRCSQHVQPPPPQQQLQQQLQQQQQQQQQ